MHGIGLEQNSKRAFQWFEKSAAQEFARAEDALGRCYIYGVGTAVNVSKGQELLTLAAQHGFTPAAVRRAPRSFVEACSAFFSRLSRKQAASHPEGESRRGAITDSNGHKSSSFLATSARSFGLGPSPTVSFAVQHRFNSVTTRDQLTSAAASGPRR
uniref:Uncharacterized protein n=1 Tax=Tetraselmis chuii TaxID=63592 RepID=A0A7S1SM14_9CHLO|mmetsp:Transcript_19359/g.34515  ORF Transcript_19359/g.34515 Transcript_19359/m.34515 type:complete len:157 (+) Transcript_19359:1-471(+)